MDRRLSFGVAAAGLLAAGVALAQDSGDVNAARREAQQAEARASQLETAARAATDEAVRARTDAAALAARIEASEADITGAEARLRAIEAVRAQQRARLAERQEPVARLTGALQMMARRPPALALVQPGSLHDLVHVRALLASTLPIVRQRTAALREEVEAGDRLKFQMNQAVKALVASREQLKTRRLALARLETSQRQRSQSFAEGALFESDRALALGEEARDISDLAKSKQSQDQLRSELASLPGPIARPLNQPGPPNPRAVPRYRLPVAGRLVTGMGEISDAGVHARGLTFATQPNAAVVAPARGRVSFAGRYRSYGTIVIIDHGSGWSSLITDLGALDVRAGEVVGAGQALGRSSASNPNVTVELRHNGEPFAITPLLAGS